MLNLARSSRRVAWVPTPANSRSPFDFAQGWLSTPLRSGRDDDDFDNSDTTTLTRRHSNFRRRVLLGFGVGDVDDGDLRGAALGDDRNHDVVSVFFACGENGSIA